MRFDFHHHHHQLYYKEQQQQLQQEQQQKKGHLAIRLPEIVSHIISYLVIPYQYDENNKIKIYQQIYPCLFVDSLWHDCATRLIWRSVTFEDSKSEYEAFLKFAAIVSNHQMIPPSLAALDMPSSAAGLAIAAPKMQSILFRDKKFLNLQKFQQQSADKKQQEVEQYYDSNADTMNEDPFYLPYNYSTSSNSDRSAIATRSTATQQQFNYSLSHHAQYRNAIRSLALRKIKDKTINEPLQQISQHTYKLEKLDIYICDHLADSSVHSFITHSDFSLTYISLAGCNRITDDAVLSVAKHCPKLEHLDLRACGLISDVSISAIAMNCTYLHHLNVGRVRDREKITMQSISLIAQHTRVAVLGLAGCDMTDECLILLAQRRGRGLERISVNNCYRITNKTVQAYVKYCPNLSVFEMKECHWIDDWGSVADLVQRKVLLTLCDQQNRACAEWARQRGRIMEVKAPVK